MKLRILVRVAAVTGLVSFGNAQSESSGADSMSTQISPEQLVLQEATALATEDRFEEAWRLLIGTPARGEEGVIASPSRLGWRVASVAGALRNRSDYAAAAAFARFALLQPWTEPGHALSKNEVADAGYWCAWLANEILGDRASAFVWIEEAEKADPESERIRKLKERLSEAERSFPTR